MDRVLSISSNLAFLTGSRVIYSHSMFVPAPCKSARKNYPFRDSSTICNYSTNNRVMCCTKDHYFWINLCIPV